MKRSDSYTPGELYALLLPFEDCEDSVLIEAAAGFLGLGSDADLAPAVELVSAFRLRREAHALALREHGSSWIQPKTAPTRHYVGGKGLRHQKRSQKPL